jgi:Carboxypeptidase regulatory-like domain
MRIIRIEILVLLTLFAVSGVNAQSDISSASISGHVYDSEGHPLQGARVIPFPLERGMSGLLPTAESDSEGAYRLNLPAFGKTRICASKKDAGYPDTSMLIFVSGKENEPEVNVAVGSRLYDVDIHLPDPDGSLDITVTDQNTGLVIPRARITLRREEDPSVMYSTDIGSNGHFHLELPNRPIQIEITAGGYEPSIYKDAISGNLFVKVMAHEHKAIAFHMSPVPKV